MRSTTLALLLSSLTTVTLQAAQLHVLAWNEAIADRKLAIAHGGGDKKSTPILRMHPFARSAPIKIPAAAENLRILVSDRSSEDGKPLHLPLEIPSSIKRPLILLLPDNQSTVGIKPLVLDDSLTNFRWGSLRMINVTGKPLVFRYDQNNVAIPAGWKPVVVTPGGKKRNMAVSIFLRENLKLPPLYSSIWKHREDLRQLVFIVPSKNKERGYVDFKFITENRAVVQAQRAEAAMKP